jgi:biopolymer transport protein ExbB
MSKSTKPAVSAAKKAESGQFSRIFAYLVIPILLVVAILIFNYVLGAPGNFENNDPAGHPKPGNYFGMMYKGGTMVPILMANFLLVIAVFLERFFTITAANGKGSIPTFVKKVQSFLSSDNVSAAIAECDKQKGSVANVVKAGLGKYQEMATTSEALERDQKVLAITKEIEEATSLEMPMLERNLVILATISSIATLLGLLGTVIGMIKAFSALATAGAPDAVALSSGISEALINTALGIGTSAFAIIFYNFFTTRIDGMTYAIDEAGFSIAQNFAAKHK